MSAGDAPAPGPAPWAGEIERRLESLELAVADQDESIDALEKALFKLTRAVDELNAELSAVRFRLAELRSAPAGLSQPLEGESEARRLQRLRDEIPPHW